MLNKTFIYLIPKGYNKKYNLCTELIIIDEFRRLGYKIFPIYRFYFIIALCAYTSSCFTIVFTSVRELGFVPKFQAREKLNGLIY